MSSQSYEQENGVKKVILIVFGWLFIACGAYAGYLFIFYMDFKNNVARITDNLTHDGMHYKGFPWTFALVISNPTLKEEVSSVSTEGCWIIGSKIFEDNNFWMEVRGKTTIDSKIVLDGTLHFNTYKPKKKLQTFNQLVLSDSLFSRMSVLQGSSFSAQNLSIAYNGDEPFFSVDQLGLEWGNVKEIAPNSCVGSLKLDLKGSELYTNGLMNLLPELKEHKLFDKWVCSGKSDFSFHTRVQFSPENDDGMPYRVDIEKFYGVNQFGTSDLSGIIEVSALEQNGLSGTVVLNCEGSTTQAYHDLQVSIYKELVEQMKAKGDFAKYPQVESLLTHHWDEIAALFPDYTTEKPVKSKFDLTFQIVKDSKNKGVEDWGCDLRKCHIQTASREFSLQGYAGLQKDTKEPFFDLQISDYKPIIQDLATYYNRWQSLLTSTKTVTAAELPYFNAAVVNRITGFVESFSTHEKPDHLHVAFKGKDMSVMLLTRLSLEMEKLVADIMPELYPDAHIAANE